MFCACEIVHLFSALSCVFRAEHKFDFSLVINEPGRDSSVGTAAHYGLDGPGIESR